MPMTRCCAALLLLVLVLTGSLGRAQDSEIITVTGLYITYSPGGEYEEILTPCDSREVWDVGSIGPAFTALAQAYASAETRGQLTKYGQLFVELRGRYTAYTGESHSDGIFGVTELVRYSTAAADITACGSECEDIYGADAPTCLAEVDGQCGRPRNSCVSGRSFDSDVWLGTTDTATYYRWTCLGEFGGDSVICTAPKPVLGEGAGPPVTARSLWDLNWSEAPPAAIQALLDQGAAAKARDRSGTTPLHFAAAGNANPAVAALLFDRGAAINGRDNRGHTPLHVAVRHSEAPVVALLLDRGTAVNARDAVLGETPLHYVAGRSKANPGGGRAAAGPGGGG